jgi:hypothetical protein
MAENEKEKQTDQEEQKQEQELEQKPFQVQLEFVKTFFNDIPVKVTPKQELFCQEYLKCGNAAEAYRRSFGTDGMKPESVWQCASRLKNNSKVIARLAQLHEKAVDKTIMSSIDVLKGFTIIAQSEKNVGFKLKALEMLGKYHKLFKDASDSNPTVPVASNITVTFISNKKETHIEQQPKQQQLTQEGTK